MNCPSRTDEENDPHHNQSPPSLSNDLTTRQDLNGVVNARAARDHDGKSICPDLNPQDSDQIQSLDTEKTPRLIRGDGQVSKTSPSSSSPNASRNHGNIDPPRGPIAILASRLHHYRQKAITTLVRYARFVGPGFMIAVAYIDPGNYATDVSAGQALRFKLLFIVLLSNLFAIFLQSLSIKLGSVTGIDLAQNCRAHLPRWLNLGLYVLAESAIIATDVAEVIGTAIALNLLFRLPLLAGCLISLVDVVFIFLFYSPEGSMTKLRIFEYFVMALVLAVVVCFCIQLAYVKDVSIGDVLKGYLPSAAVVQGNGIYLSCGILGATVMPHSIFLGSGIVQPRLREFERDECIDTGVLARMSTDTLTEDDIVWRPSLATIRSCMKYSIVELSVSLFSFALFVNSSILIVAGYALHGKSSASDADLFGIYDLLSDSISPGAGTLFALALLLSGISAGIVCTIAGQMVSEGMINWTVRPWIRRLATRSISVLPSVAIAASAGKAGLNTALLASQVVLSVMLPFVTAPLIYFTCRRKYMTVRAGPIRLTEPRELLAANAQGDVRSEEDVDMSNGWIVTILGVLVWGVLAVMNMALLVLVGLGET